MKKLLVLAGGFGTRLRSLVSDVPKPLAPVEDKPFLEYLIYNWVDQGVSEFIFLLHYEANKIKNLLGRLEKDEALSKTKFTTLIERKPLGTGGALLNAIKVLDLKESFLVANADTWLGSGMNELDNLKPCCLGALRCKNTERYGLLEINKNKVSSFREKSNSNGSGYINSGLYHLTTDVFEDFKLGSYFSLEEDVFPNLVNNKKLFAHKLETDFIDIGVPEDYLRFCNWINKGKSNAL